MSQESTAGDQGFAAYLAEAGPLACIVYDRLGVVRWLNESAAALVSRRRDDLIGANVLDFVHEPDCDDLVEHMAHAEGIPSEALGPLRVRYPDRTGRIRYTEMWTANELAQPGIEGYVSFLTEEAAHHRFATAVSAIAAGEPAREALVELAGAMSGHPMVGCGAIVSPPDDSEEIEVFTDEPIVGDLMAGPGPWRGIGRAAGIRIVDDLGALDEATTREAHRLGLVAVWAEPVDFGAAGVGALVVWRRSARSPTPNQSAHLRQAASIAGLAVAQESQRAELRRMAFTDSLTGLANRARLFSAALGEVPGEQAVLYVDLDGFKTVNDTWGHSMGDDVLRVFAERLRRVVRGDDLVARIGGDEFVVLCGAPCDDEIAARIASRIVRTGSQPIMLDGSSIALGASVGVAMHDGAQDLDSLLREADGALYRAKIGGRHRWVRAGDRC
ncbi:MAG: diguanylate cyclase domain-containing protein [Acidimicrobiales bacterium]